jgi:hypothetical protein
MSVTLESFMHDFTPAERERVDARAKELIAEESARRTQPKARNSPREEIH